MKKITFLSLKIVLSLGILLLGNLFYFTQVNAQSCPSGYIQSGSAHTEESNCTNSLSNFQNFNFECTLNKTCDIYSVIDCQSLAFSNTTQVRTFVSRQSSSEPLGVGQCYNSGCITNADCAGASTSSCTSTCSASGGGPNIAGYCSSCFLTAPRIECVLNRGQSCDDGNPDTANDRIQCDGSCAGTTPNVPGGGGGTPTVTLRRCSVGSCSLATFPSDNSLVQNGSLTNECNTDVDCRTNLVTEITPISNTINKGESTAVYNVKFKFDGGLKKAALNIRALFNGSGASNITWSGSGFNAVSSSSNNGTLGFGGGTERNLFLRIKNPESLNPGTFGVNVSAQTGDVSSVGADNLYNFSNCFGNCNSNTAASLVVTETTPTPCTNGATNPPTCNNNTPTPCASGSSRVNGVCVPNTNTTPCANGATNPPSCNTCASGFSMISGTCTPNTNVTPCTNGATNPPSCNTCASGFSMISGTCTPNTSTCANGATNPPACNNNIPGACTNGATNPPTCNHCASGYSFNGTMCVEQVSMSGSISSTPPSCFIALGDSSCNVTLNWNTNHPEAVSEVTSSYPVAGTSIANGNNGGKTVAIPHFSSPRSFYLYNNSKLVDQVSVVADCVIGTVWDINTSKCIASNVTVMSGALMPDRDNCVIPTGSNACLIQFSWMTVHPEAVSRVTSDTTDTGNPAADTFVVDGNNGGPAPFVIPYPSRNFFLYNNGVLLDQKAGGTITAVCASDASFDVSRNKCMSTVPNNPGSGIPGGGGIGGGGNGSDIVFDASAKNIFTGQPTTLTWSSSFACTGTNFNTGGASTGNLTLRPVTTTTYTVTCGGHSRSLTVVVRRQPGFIEQ